MLIYPWSDEDSKQSERERFALTQVKHNLQTLGYNTNVPSPSVKVEAFVSNIVKSIIRRPSWKLIVSRNAHFLEVLEQILPQVYALSALKSVQPIDPKVLYAYYRAKDREDVLHLFPFGYSAVEEAGLVWFTNPTEGSKSLGRWHGDSSALFRGWSRSYISVIMSHHCPVPWNKERYAFFLQDIDSLYGSIAKNLVRERMAEPTVVDAPTTSVEYRENRISLK